MGGFARLLCILLLCMPSAPLLAQSRKPIVAIYDIQDLAKTGLGETFSTMIETAITSTGKFRVMERKFANLSKEQMTAKSGMITTNRPGKMGGFEGADLLIYGAITSVSVNRKSNLGSSMIASMLTGKNGATVSCSNAFATLGVDVKITDASSGEVKYVTRLDETQRSSAACGGDAQVDTAALMRSAADKIATGLVTTIYPIVVAAVQGDGQVVLNYGQGAITPGATMTVYAPGEAIRDPQTGEKIGTNETRLGFVKVTEVTPRLSKAAPLIAFASPPPVGSVVRPSTSTDLEALAAASKPQKKHK